MQGLTSIEDAESFMLKHGESIVDALGGEVDRIEQNLKVYYIQLQLTSTFTVIIKTCEYTTRYLAE